MFAHRNRSGGLRVLSKGALVSSKPQAGEKQEHTFKQRIRASSIMMSLTLNDSSLTASRYGKQLSTSSANVSLVSANIRLGERTMRYGAALGGNTQSTSDAPSLLSTSKLGLKSLTRTQWRTGWTGGGGRPRSSARNAASSGKTRSAARKP